MIIAADALFHAGRLARGWLRTSGERVEDAGFGDAPGRADERVRFPPDRRGIDNEDRDAREAEEVRPGVP